MGATNSTPNYDLPLFVDSDRPSWTTDWNGAMETIDLAIKQTKTLVDSNTSSVTQVNTALTALRETVSTINDTVDTLVTDDAENKTKIAKNSESIKNVQLDLQQQNTLVLKLQEEVNSLKTFSDTITQEVHGIENDINRIDGEITPLKSDVSTLKTNLASLTETVEELQTRLNQIDGGLSSLTSMYNELNRTVTALGNQVNTLGSQVDKNKSDIAENGNDIGALQINVAALEKQPGICSCNPIAADDHFKSFRTLSEITSNYSKNRITILVPVQTTTSSGNILVSGTCVMTASVQKNIGPASPTLDIERVSYVDESGTVKTLTYSANVDSGTGYVSVSVVPGSGGATKYVNSFLIIAEEE